MPSFGRSTVERAGAAVVGLWVVGALIGWGGERGGAWVSDVSMVAFSSFAAFCLFRAALRRPRGRRRPMLLLGAAATAYAVGESIWGWYELIAHVDVPFPSVADIAYLSAAPLAGAGLLVLSRGVRQRSHRARTLLDGWLVAGSLLAAGWDIFITPIADNADGGTWGITVAVAYPVTDVVLVTVAVLVLRAGSPANRRSIGLVAAGMLAMACSDTAFSGLELVNKYHSGMVVDAGWVAAYLLLAFAGLADVRSSEDSTADVPVGKAAALAPYALVGVAMAFVGGAALFGRKPGPVAIGLLVSLAVALLVRQALTVLDNAVLASLLELRERHFRSLVQGTKDVIVLCGRDLRATYVSPASATVLGISPERIVGRPLWDLVHPDDLRSVQQELARVLDGETTGETTLLRCRMATADGWVDTESTVGDLRGDPSVAALVVTTRDVSDRTELERQLRKLACEDSLTGLANRALLHERLDHVLAQRRPPGFSVCLLLLDLDGFKAINDTYGHATGDALLVQVSERLLQGVRRGDTVARLGGDEFAVVLEMWNVDDPATVASDVANTLLASITQPMVVDGRELTVGASFGLVAAPHGAVTGDLLRQADFALYASKEGGRGRVTIFGPELASASTRRTQLAQSLGAALAHGDLEMAYQPIVDIDTGVVRGAEALARWEHTAWGPISPAEFVPIAESTGLITQLGAWALREAAVQAARWHCEGLDLGVAVNVSVRQLGPDFVGEVADVLRTTALPPGRLTLEITESVLVDDDRTVTALAALHELGVRVALDDFGTGWSSLSYLSRLPIDVLKLDGSFVSGLGSAEADAVSRTVLQLASDLGLEVVAEGVETTAQRDLLVSMGCRTAQGWLYGAPGPASRVTAPRVPQQRRPGVPACETYVS